MLKFRTRKINDPIPLFDEIKTVKKMEENKIKKNSIKKIKIEKPKK